jgi:hypothetical protein
MPPTVTRSTGAKAPEAASDGDGTDRGDAEQADARSASPTTSAGTNGLRILPEGLHADRAFSRRYALGPEPGLE